VYLSATFKYYAVLFGTMDDQITFCLRVDRETWESFKKTVTRDRSLNTAMNEMIAARVIDVLGTNAE